MTVPKYLQIISYGEGTQSQNGAKQRSVRLVDDAGFIVARNPFQMRHWDQNIGDVQGRIFLDKSIVFRCISTNNKCTF